VRVGLAVTTVAAVGTAVSLAAGSAGGAPRAHASACHVKNNVEDIIDDSGSMAGNDPNRLRVAGTKLFMNTPGNERKTLGAIQFGQNASAVFGPGVIKSNRTSFSNSLDQQIMDDGSGVGGDSGGGTNYNAAFSLANSHNPNATARIFLTDGGHNEGTYNNGHQGGPPTHVIGLGSGFSSTDEQRLRQIASDTHGSFQQASTASQIQSDINRVSARLNCQLLPVTYSDAFTHLGQSKRHSLRIPRGLRKVLFGLTWDDTGDNFTIYGIRIIRNHHVVAKTSRVIHLRRKKRHGATFVTLEVYRRHHRRLPRGRLRFRVKPTRLSGGGGATLVTQATRSRRR
jgi:hypothetical protein